jgi:hypothetical protein
MIYRRAGMSDLMNSPATWDNTDWVFAGLIGFAVWAGFSALKLAFGRLK